MQRKRYFFILVLLICILSACSVNTVPAEYIHPLENSNQFVFSFGADASTEVSVCFRAEADTAELQYMPMQAYLQAGFCDYTSIACTPCENNRFEAYLTGLSPDCAYVCRANYQNRVTDIYRFQTGAASDFSFLYMSDTQKSPDLDTDYSVFGNLFAQAEKENAAFLMIGGDLINQEKDAGEWQSFFTAADLSKLPVMPAAGNHTGGAEYRSYFSLPKNGPVDYPEQFYSFDYGCAHFIVLDSNYMGSLDAGTVAAIQTWLKNDLAASSGQWNIVMMHHPLYPITLSPKNETRAQTMRDNYLPVFEQYGVDLVLCGHEHVNAYTYPIQDRFVQWMCVSGGKMYAPASYDYIKSCHADLSCYTYITVTEKDLTLTLKDSTGNSVDSICIQKEKQK